MRRTLLVSLAFAGLAPGQAQMHLTSAPLSGGRQVTMAADEITRTGDYPSTVHLKGAVEIRTPVCLSATENSKPLCDGQTIVRSDEATFHEDTGQIEAKGSVTVVPLFHEPRAAAR